MKRYELCKYIRRTKSFLVALLHFCFRRIASKMVSFQGFFTFKRTFGSYIEQNVCTHLENICSWTRSECSKFITNTYIFWLLFHPFCSRKIASEMLNFQGFLLRKKSLAATLSQMHSFISRRYVAEQGTQIPKISKTLKLFWSHSSAFAFQ